jgi:hypothetical protein
MRECLTADKQDSRGFFERDPQSTDITLSAVDQLGHSLWTGRAMRCWPPGLLKLGAAVSGVTIAV